MVNTYVFHTLFIIALFCIPMYTLFGSKNTCKRDRLQSGLEKKDTNNTKIKKKKLSEIAIKNVAIILNRDGAYHFNLEDAIVGEIAACFGKSNMCMVVDGISLSFFIEKLWHLDDFIKTLHEEHHVCFDQAFYQALKNNKIFNADTIDFFKKGWDVYHIKNTLFFVCVPPVFYNIGERLKKSNNFSLVLDHNDNKKSEEIKKNFELTVKGVEKDQKNLSNNLAQTFTLFMDSCKHENSVPEERWNIVLEGHGIGRKKNIEPYIADLTPRELQEFLDALDRYHCEKKWVTNMLFVSSCHIGGKNQKFFHTVYDNNGKIVSKKTRAFPIVLSCPDALLVTFPFLKVPQCPDFFEQAKSFRSSDKRSVEKFLDYCSRLNAVYEMPFLKKYDDKHQRNSIPLLSLPGTTCFTLYPIDHTVSIINDDLFEDIIVNDAKLLGLSSRVCKKPLCIAPVIRKRVIGKKKSLSEVLDAPLAISLAEYVLDSCVENESKRLIRKSIKNFIQQKVPGIEESTSDYFYSSLGCFCASDYYKAMIKAQYPAFVFYGDWSGLSSHAFYFEKIIVAGKENDTNNLGPAIQFICDSFCDMQICARTKKTILIKDLACGPAELLGFLLINKGKKLDNDKPFYNNTLIEFLLNAQSRKENIVLHNVIILVKKDESVEIMFSCAKKVTAFYKRKNWRKWKIMPAIKREGGALFSDMKTKAYSEKALEKEFERMKRSMLPEEEKKSFGEEVQKVQDSPSSPTFLSSFTGGGCAIQ